MNQLWDRFKWMGTSLAGLIAGLILFIDPSHIDKLIATHPKWAGLILFLWTTLVSWANKTKPQPPQPDVYPPGTGANPVTGGEVKYSAQQQQQKGKPYTKGLVG